jgi:DNA replication protein DnaC
MMPWVSAAPGSCERLGSTPRHAAGRAAGLRCAPYWRVRAGARSIKYQITIAKLTLAKDIDDFASDDAPVNETLVRDLTGGDILAHQRNVVLVGGTGTGKTHLAIAIARSRIRGAARGRFFNVVDLVNKLEAEAPAGRQGRKADHLSPAKALSRQQCITGGVTLTK